MSENFTVRKYSRVFILQDDTFGVCTFFGCASSSRHTERSFFKIPSANTTDGDETTALKSTAQAEWLRLLLRTREITEDLKTRIDANNICLCDLHFKPECIISHPKRKVLATGTVPTENLPTQSHEGETKKHRVLVKHTFPDQPSTSTGVTSSTSTINALLNQLRKSDVLSCWKVLDDTSSGFKMELYDDCHSVPKYTMICDSGLTFTLFTYHWPIPDDHTLYQEYNRSVRAENINKLLRSIESSQLCEGLPHIPDVKDIAIDPTSNDRVPGTILRHSVPKKLANNEAVYEVSVSFRSVDCTVLKESQDHQDNTCKPCSDSLKAITKASKQKSRSSSVPAKAKAPLSACGPEKLRATVKATRLQNKQLEDRLEILQAKIEKDGIG
ncbi:Transposable element P transposase, partial [Paramuricea clavata]